MILSEDVGRFIREIFDPNSNLYMRTFSENSCHLSHGLLGLDECTPGLTYIARCGDLYKIGFTSLRSGVKTLEGRLEFTSRRLRIKFYFHHAVWSCCGHGLEDYLHRRFGYCNFILPYQAGPDNEASEIFKLNETDLVWINQLSSFSGNPIIHFNDITEVSSFVKGGKL